MTQPAPAPVAAPGAFAPPAAGRTRVGTMRRLSGRYSDGMASYQRVSTLLKNLDTDTYHLEKWKLRQVARGVALRPDIAAGVAAIGMGPDGKPSRDDRDTLDALCRQATAAAGSSSGSNMGTAVHSATERLDAGEPLEAIRLPYPLNADLAAYAHLKQALGLTFDPRHIERSVRIPALGVVGTLDRIGISAKIAELFGRPLPMIVDVKTENDPLLNLLHIAAQLACYSRGDGMWIPEPTPDDDRAGRYEPMPAVDQELALIVHVRNGLARPILVDLTQGWEAAQAAAAQRERVKRAKVELGRPGCWALAVPYEPPAAAELTSASVQQHVTQHPAVLERAERQLTVSAEQLAPDAPSLATAVLDASRALAVADASYALAEPPAVTDTRQLPTPVHVSIVTPGGGRPGTATGGLGGTGSVTTIVSGSDTRRLTTPGSVRMCGPGGVTAVVGLDDPRVPPSVSAFAESLRHEPAPTVVTGMEAMMIEALEQAPDRPELGRLYDKWTRELGLDWTEPLAVAGRARTRIIDCVQRNMHKGAGALACACGWSERLRP